MQNQKGFTLIELMIVIAIIAILAAIALPAYQNYVARSQVSEAISLAASFKTPVGLHVTEEGVCPTLTDRGFTGLEGTTDAVGQYVQSIAFGNGTEAGTCTITANMGGEANAKVESGTIILTSSPIAEGAEDGNGIAKWTCTATNLTEDFLPKSCQP